MKKLAGYGIIAGMVGAALGVFFLSGGTWADLLGLGAVFGVIALFAGVLVLTGELWDRGHRWVSVLTAVILMVVLPSVVLQWLAGAWWLLFAVAGAFAGILLAVVVAGRIVRFALDLIKGDK